MKKLSISRRAWPLMVSGFALMGSAGAMAQTDAAADSAAAAPDSFDIIVTAQKRAQNLTDVPISVTAVQAGALAENGFDSVMDLAQVVPALRVDQNGGYTAPTIRGVGSSIAGTGFSNNVAIYVDGFYNPSQSTTDSLFVNIESIEVLKGPQGTLFGRNATGGAILMRLREPSTTPTVEGRVSYGRYNSMDAALYASAGLGDKLAIDFSGAFSRSDGFLTSVVTGNDEIGQHKNYAVRSALMWKPIDGVSFKLAYQHSESHDNRPYATGALEDAAGNPMSFGPVVGGIAPTERGKVANSAPTRFNSNVDGVYLTSVFDLGGAELKSYTMFRKEKTENYLDLDSSSTPAFEGVFFLQNKTFSQEFNLSGSSDRVDWLAGLFYLHHKDNQGPFPVLFGEALTGAPGGVLVDLYSAGVNINAYAIYGDATYRFGDRLFATVGMRYSYEESEAFWNLEPLAVAFGIGAGNAPGRVDFNGNWSSFTPRAVLRYELDDHSNVYASYSKGFKSGLLTPNGFDTTPLQPEKIDAYEVGVKYGGSRLRASLAAFYYNYKDLQVAAFVSGTGVYRNAANSEIYGVEGSVSARITDEFQIDAGAAYTHARYQRFLGSSQYEPSGTGTFVATPIDASGFQMQRAPDWSGNVSANWNKTVGDYKIGLNGNFYFTSKFPFDTAETFYEGGYSIVNIGAKFGAADGTWEVNAYARNLFDTKYHTQILPGDFAIQQVYGEPLTYGVGLAFHF
jgi:iron complex outermembrane receptor protein